MNFVLGTVRHWMFRMENAIAAEDTECLSVFERS